MSVATGIGKKTIWLINGIIDIAVLIIILLFVITGCYAVWDSKQVYKAADAARYEIYKPTAQNESKSFLELQAINPEVFGWITIYGTHIDYPVVQSPNLMKYVNTNAEGQYSLSGAIFLDSNSSMDFSDFNSIIYGHHMEKQTMFGEIGNFSDNDYFDVRKYGTLYYDGQEHGLEFFAFVHADAYDSTIFRTKISGQENQKDYLNMLIERAAHTREIQITANDRIVLLSTCSSNSTNGRDILVGKITDEIQDDPFIIKESDKKNNILTAVDKIPKLWVQTPLWIRITALIMLTGFLLLILILVINNKKRNKINTRRRR
ncbi:MAG: class B sortase [Oscillospiraceae bacterium]|nr:class B sortase [Oscillospiraceae bacterium]